MIEFEHNGQTYLCRDGRDMLKACGTISGTGRAIVMTDEEGQLVGIGIDDHSLLKSMSTIRAIREMPLLKASPKSSRPISAKAIPPKPHYKSKYDELMAFVDRRKALEASSC